MHVLVSPHCKPEGFLSQNGQLSNFKTKNKKKKHREKKKRKEKNKELCVWVDMGAICWEKGRLFSFFYADDKTPFLGGKRNCIYYQNNFTHGDRKSVV